MNFSLLPCLIDVCHLGQKTRNTLSLKGVTYGRAEPCLPLQAPWRPGAPSPTHCHLAFLGITWPSQPHPFTRTWILQEWSKSTVGSQRWPHTACGGQGPAAQCEGLGRRPPFPQLRVGTCQSVCTYTLCRLWSCFPCVSFHLSSPQGVSITCNQEASPSTSVEEKFLTHNCLKI